MQSLIKWINYDGVRKVADTLALFTAATARDVLEEELLTREPWIMVPIPLHPRRERERGFNQSALFAEALAHHEPLRGTVLVHALRRTRHTNTQTEKPDYQARRINVADC
ncbi:MAG: hypothetical protein Q8P88_02560, partial [Candidatus Jorgensenbacteria bacterium]|nr:hypothetical protein [Candidatus Jorgensenbacteria bacterium]